MSDSCWIHAFSMILRFGVELEVFSKILVQIWLGRGWCWIHVEFMLNSCWFHFYLEVSQRFAQHFASHWCWFHVEFMLNSCRIQAKPWKIFKFANKVAFEAFNWIMHAIYYQRIQSGIFQKTAKMVKNIYFSRKCLNSAWIQHHCYAKCCAKHCENLRWKWNQHEISMNSAWIRHEFNTIVMQSVGQSIVKI